MTDRVVAIDGPSGSGKSTVARGVASALGLHVLDTGAMYRSVTLAVLTARVDIGRRREVRADRASMPTIELEDEIVRLDGRDVSAEIRGPEVTAAVSAVVGPSAGPPASRGPPARVGRASTAAGWSRAATSARSSSPTPPVKVFLTASDEERARRRQRDEVAAAAAGGRRRGAGVAWPGATRWTRDGRRRRSDRADDALTGRHDGSAGRRDRGRDRRRSSGRRCRGRHDVLPSRAHDRARPVPDRCSGSGCRGTENVPSVRRVHRGSDPPLEPRHARSPRSSRSGGSGSWRNRSCSGTRSARSSSPRLGGVPVERGSPSSRAALKATQAALPRRRAGGGVPRGHPAPRPGGRRICSTAPRTSR